MGQGLRGLEYLMDEAETPLFTACGLTLPASAGACRLQDWGGEVCIAVATWKMRLSASLRWLWVVVVPQGGGTWRDVDR